MHELMAAWAPLQGVALALALGLLIGVERGWRQRDEAAGTRVAGIRTFGLLGLTGGLAWEAGRLAGPGLAAVIVGLAGATLLIGYYRAAVRETELSATNTIVGAMTLAIGLMAAAGQGVIASAVAAVTVLVLASRERLHAWVDALDEAELHAIARFGLIALAILPVLPDASYGPYDAWNPRQIWMVVVLVSGLSLAGYAAARRFGASKGVLITAAAGSLVSSTAVTAALAARLARREGGPAVLIAGIAVAHAVMLTRVVVLVGVLAPFALAPMAVLIVPAGLAAAACAGWLLWRAKDDTTESDGPPPVKNPFDIVPALLLAGLVAAMSLLGRWALDAFGNQGLMVVLALSGLLDVDSAIVTAANLTPGTLAPAAAALALAAPIAANTLVKAGLALAVARGAAGLQAAILLTATVVAGAAAYPLLAVLFG
ncbi:MAG: MgtC/SapB family protein [Phenylobacterium sp.]|nr:MgtC/SapB family protein [Phenylobacterium sp.]